MNKWAAVVFAVLWIVTFFPAWKLLLKLLALSVSDRRVDLKFVATFVLYRLIIALPYIFLLILGRQLPNLLANLVISILALGLILSFVRFFLRRQAVRLLWGAYSYVYDGLLKFYPYAHLLSLVAGKIQPMRGQQILDAGCGTGNLSLKLAGNNPGNKITAIDSSAKMIKRAQKKLNKYDGVEVYNLGVLDYFERYPEKKFDVIVLVNVLYALDNRSQFWYQALCHLKPDGKLVITNSDRGGSWPIIQEHLRHSNFAQLLRPSLLGVFAIDFFISQLADTGRFHFLSLAELRAEVADAGGVIEDVERCYGGSQKGVNLLFTVTPDR